MRYSLLFTSLVLTLFGTAQLNTAKLDSLFNQIDAHDNGMGSVSIYKDGKLQYANTIGYANLEEEIKSNEDTKYRIGSLSKTYTAAVIMKLVESGDLKLKTKLKKFIPEIPNAKKITIEHLLRHTSGVFNFTNDQGYFSYNHKPISRESLLGKIASHESQFKPGTAFEYSNSNYVLLTYIAEDVTGKDFSELVNEFIVNPLKLKRTGYGQLNDSTDNDAFSYNDFGGWEREKITHMSVPEGAGGIAASTNDVAKFLDALFSAQIVSQESLDLMLEFQGKLNYGLGIYNSSRGDSTWIGHNGGVDGFQTSGFYHPKTKRTLVYVSNGTLLQLTDIISSVVNILDEKEFDFPKFTVRGAISDVDLKSYEGSYALEGFPLKIQITVKDDSLVAQATGQGSFTLHPVGVGKYEYKPAGIRMLFESDTQKMILIQQGVRIDFTKEEE
jgi:CubicO group peptidase (beta-lactamase class C family)